MGIDETGEIEDTFRSKRNDVRASAIKALLRLLEPLTGFVIDAGLSTKELHSILRQAAVRSVASRQLEVSRRINISGIAAATGIPRSEISRILKSSETNEERPVDHQQKSTNRILAAWHEEPKFTDANGQPADLKLYGRGATFESLARRHGRGIPTRALLDELVRARAVKVLSSQKIRAKAPLAVHRGMSPQVIKAFGDRATELLSAMLTNMREPENPQFIANVSGCVLAPRALPLFRKEVSSKSAEFLADVGESLMQEPRKRRGVNLSNTVSVTIYYHESPRKENDERFSKKRRRNFRRK